jgi:hypothetical protein
MAGGCCVEDDALEVPVLRSLQELDNLQVGREIAYR